MNGSIEDIMKDPINAAIITQLYNLSKDSVKENHLYDGSCPRYNVPCISQGIESYTNDEIRARLIEMSKMENCGIIIGPTPFAGLNEKFGLSEDTINFIEESKIVIKL